MANFKLKCMHCGYDFELNSVTATTVCPKCNKTLDSDMAIKYQQNISRIKTEKTKIAEGEIYAKVDSLLSEGDYYLKNGDFEKALEIASELEQLTNRDGRIYMLKVLAKTENFENLEETSHYKDLTKAIELSSFEEKERIKKLYAPYYRKRSIPKEERRDYEDQESSSILNKIEDLLKSGIPSHFKREKFVKIAFPLVIALAVLTVVGFILSIALNNTVIAIISSVLFIGFIVMLSTFISSKNKTTIYNAVLDLYDIFPTLHLESNIKLKVSKLLYDFAVSVSNGESETKGEIIVADVFFELVNSNCKNAQDFVLLSKDNKKILDKYYE